MLEYRRHLLQWNDRSLLLSKRTLKPTNYIYIFNCISQLRWLSCKFIFNFPTGTSHSKHYSLERERFDKWQLDTDPNYFSWWMIKLLSVDMTKSLQRLKDVRWKKAEAQSDNARAALLHFHGSELPTVHNLQMILKKDAKASSKSIM